MNDADCALMVFARAPVPGRVKTRLAGVLGEQGAAVLYESLVDRTLRQAAGTSLPLQLWCTPDETNPFFARCADRYHCTLHRQSPGTLGDRMHYAFVQTLRRFDAAVLVGCDCPGLSNTELEDAVHRLRNDADLVLGPAEDGGYYLVGMRAPCPELFQDMPWGGDTVLSRTRAIAARLRLRTAELSLRRDLDRPDDLDHFRRTGLIP